MKRRKFIQNSTASLGVLFVSPFSLYSNQNSDVIPSELTMVIPFGTGVSHFGWRNNDEVIATFTPPGGKKMKHYLFPDKTTDYQVVGESFSFAELVNSVLADAIK